MLIIQIGSGEQENPSMKPQLWKIKNPFLIIPILLLIYFLTLNSCIPKSTPYKIEKATFRESCDRKIISTKADILKNFSEILINAYLDLLHEEVNQAFWDSFLLTKSQNISVGVLFSIDGQSLINIFPSNADELIVECTRYPVQFTFFGGLIDFRSPKVHKYSIKPEYINIYNRVKPIFGTVDVSNMYYTSYGTGEPPKICVEYPKFFSLGKRSSVIISDINFITEKHLKPLISNYINGILVMNGEDNLEWFAENAEKVGRRVLISEIKNLIEHSTFFKLSLFHKKISPKAKEIKEKQKRNDTDPSFEYPLWQYKKEIVELKQIAKTEGIDTTYVDELITSLKPHGGFLLWHYSDFLGFMWQWIIVNLILLVILTILNYLSFKLPTFMIYRISIPSIIVLINGWIFLRKPESLGVIYWIIPGLFFFICIILAIRMSFISNKIQQEKDKIWK